MKFRAGNLLAMLALLAGILPAAADSDIVCTLVVGAETGAVLIEEGDCTSRVTPASTFKVPLAVIGFDSGFLSDPETPVLSFRPGDPDWGAHWKEDTTPERWMKYSVLWYSQRITHALGAAEMERRVRAMGYGNADFSGDPGADNALDRAWVASSLKISPREQTAFLRKFLDGTLPASPEAIGKARAIVENWPAGEWTVSGKTGAAFPRRTDGSFDYTRGWGWFVGWAEKDEERVVVARLAQTKVRVKGSFGAVTRDRLIKSWPELMASIGR